jgi:hypothetical protein
MFSLGRTTPPRPRYHEQALTWRACDLNGVHICTADHVLRPGSLDPGLKIRALPLIKIQSTAHLRLHNAHIPLQFHVLHFQTLQIHFHGTCGGGDASRFLSQVFSRAEALKGIRHSRMDSFTRFRTLHFTTYSYSPHPRPRPKSIGHVTITVGHVCQRM